ncbi:TPA: phage tail protein, partial [Salmonella enterica subsp. enterica serovar Heidelberg]|nr:phage tail protein [Salmonella enterica subsp. enterica serovar Heidelberg]
RVTTAEGEIASLQTNVSALDGRVTTAENNISALQADYVSKTATTSQSLASPLNVTTSYSVGGKKVVGARQTGWTAATGTANKGVFDADLTFAVSDTYTQSEIQAIANALITERRRTKALEDALRAHGLID